MVMGRRPDVETASAPVAAVAVAGLVAQLGTALVSVPFRKPWEGPVGRMQNIGMTVTRTVLRAFIGYATSLPIPELRSVEILVDGICRTVFPPFLKGLGVAARDAELGGVPVLEYRPANRAHPGAILYLHGGGFIGTSPSMYAAFTGWIARETGCRVIVPDYRLAPEFPFPASLLDAASVYQALLAEGQNAEGLFVAGDSGGGNLATSLLVETAKRRLPGPAGLILFSPELSLILDEPSITENASRDILPWNIPVRPYLQGVAPADGRVSMVDCDAGLIPSTFVAFGGDEMFRDPIRRFAQQIARSGVDTTAIEEPGMFHVFPILMPWADASRRVYRAVGDFVRKRLHPRVQAGSTAGALAEGSRLPAAGGSEARVTRSVLRPPGPAS